MTNLRTVTLGELTTNFDAKRKPIKSTERVKGSFPYYGASSIVDYVEDFIFDGEYLLIAEDGENLRSRNTPIAFIANGRFWVNNHAHVVQGNELADTRYLSYLLSETDISGYLTGSTQPKLTRKALDSIRLQVPELPVQRAVANVLSALDDKIAANIKLAAIADKLAVTKFRQALAYAKFSEETFADVAKVSGGGTPNTKERAFWNGNIRWATPTDVTALQGPYLETTSRSITESGLTACASALYPEGSILMTSRATIGAFALAQVPTAVNQGFIVVQPNDPTLHYWIFHEMRSRVDEFISFANGATFLELSRGNFKNFKVRKASEDIMRTFNDTASGLHEAARAALLENDALVLTRDTLLPQLMSDKLRVKDAEALVESVV